MACAPRAASRCAADRQREETRTEQGLTAITITGVNITGGSATAALNAQNELLVRSTIEIKLAREDGWKVCMTYTG